MVALDVSRWTSVEKVSALVRDWGQPDLLALPAELEVIPAKALQDCWRPAVIDLGECKISEVGEFSLQHCLGLKRFVAPASLRRVGEMAFAGSGLRVFEAGGSRASIGALCSFGMCGAGGGAFGCGKVRESGVSGVHASHSCLGGGRWGCGGGSVGR
jgi:hypothetical protein